MESGLGRHDLGEGNISQAIDLTFDSENTILEGWYSDELSAYRAKKGWSEILGKYFLLEHKVDFTISAQGYPTAGVYGILCEFGSACGRYAFWRITNNQAQEAQYLIETAHLTGLETNNHAPDLRQANPLSFDPEEKQLSFHQGWKDDLLRMINRLVKKID